jgi:hypothetical protein
MWWPDSTENGWLAHNGRYVVIVMGRGAPSRERLQRAERVQRQMERERERKHRKGFPAVSPGGSGDRTGLSLAAKSVAVANKDCAGER